MEKRCPHCGKKIQFLNCYGTFDQMEYGTCSGTYDLETEETRTDIDSVDGHGSYEDSIDEYECPECSEIVYLEDLLDADDEEDNEDIEEQSKTIEFLLKNIK